MNEQTREQAEEQSTEELVEIVSDEQLDTVVGGVTINMSDF